MNYELRQLFPMLRDRFELLTEIERNDGLSALFSSWPEARQEEFLDFCTGAKGVKILYDAFFKKILDPETAPERVEALLSLLLEEKVKILQVLQLDSPRIADEKSLLIMDIVIRMENGSLVNLEMQKIGYAFPGARSACYSADLLLRQYRQLRDEKKKNFSYRDIKAVYTVILFEQSPGIFSNFPEDYIHIFKQASNTGIEIDLLQKFIYLPLDIFRKRTHNKDIANRLEAWLTFLSTDEPEQIARLVEAYPEFRAMYEEIYTMCQDIERVMGMFSEELLELDRNTVDYMIDEMQNEINQLKTEVAQEKQKAEQEKQKLTMSYEETIAKLQEQLRQSNNTQ